MSDPPIPPLKKSPFGVVAGKIVKRVGGAVLDALSVAYSNGTSGLAATQTQAAIDELAARPTGGGPAALKSAALQVFATKPGSGGPPFNLRFDMQMQDDYIVHDPIYDIASNCLFISEAGQYAFHANGEGYTAVDQPNLVQQYLLFAVRGGNQNLTLPGFPFRGRRITTSQLDPYILVGTTFLTIEAGDAVYVWAPGSYNSTASFAINVVQLKKL